MKFLKKSLFRLLGLKAYLSLLQKIYLLSYKTGYLRNNNSYDWHYFVKKLIKPGDVIIDIGANLGYFTYVFITTLKQSGHVYSVEPVEAYREQLKNVIKDNSSVTVLPFALGDKNEPSITLGMPAAFEDLGYLRHGVVTLQTEERSIAGSYQFNSELKRGSEVFGNLQRLDYIKCDIEGHETVVLKEMRDVLQKHKPLVQLETWGEQLPVMLEYFKSLGFQAYHLAKGKLINVDGLEMSQVSSSDVLFAHDERIDRLRPFLN
jgi:FkbM family methyltransferase